MTRLILTRHACGTHPQLPITPEEYETIKAARSCVLEVMAVEERLDLVLGNYEELEQELLNASLSEALYDDPDDPWNASMGMMQRFARRLANLLTTTRAYCDQLPHAMNALYGHDSSQSAAVKAFFHGEYDTVLGYRVCEALRNYVQHRGSPIHEMTKL